MNDQALKEVQQALKLASLEAKLLEMQDEIANAVADAQLAAAQRDEAIALGSFEARDGRIYRKSGRLYPEKAETYPTLYNHLLTIKVAPVSLMTDDEIEMFHHTREHHDSSRSSEVCDMRAIVVGTYEGCVLLSDGRWVRLEMLWNTLNAYEELEFHRVVIRRRGLVIWPKPAKEETSNG